MLQRLYKGSLRTFKGVFGPERTWLVVWVFLSSIDLYSESLDLFQHIFCLCRIPLKCDGSIKQMFA